MSNTFDRRSFYKTASAGIAACLAVSAVSARGITLEGDIDLGSGDMGILSYAYALEQLESAFYTEVIMKPFKGITSMERSFLTDIRNDEIGHREWFRKVLTSSKVKDFTVEFDFSSVNFGDRDSVLHTARLLEDTGVSAFNGAGPLLTSAAFLGFAGKIVSVEARHAAYIRDLIHYGDYAGSDVIDANGMDAAIPPAVILQHAGPFFKSKVNGSNLPTRQY
jgi:hypothetical protein